MFMEPPLRAGDSLVLQSEWLVHIFILLFISYLILRVCAVYIKLFL